MILTAGRFKTSAMFREEQLPTTYTPPPTQNTLVRFVDVGVCPFVNFWHVVCLPYLFFIFDFLEGLRFTF